MKEIKENKEMEKNKENKENKENREIKALEEFLNFLENSDSLEKIKKNEVLKKYLIIKNKYLRNSINPEYKNMFDDSGNFNNTENEKIKELLNKIKNKIADINEMEFKMLLKWCEENDRLPQSNAEDLKEQKMYKTAVKYLKLSKKYNDLKIIEEKIKLENNNPELEKQVEEINFLKVYYSKALKAEMNNKFGKVDRALKDLKEIRKLYYFVKENKRFPKFFSSKDISKEEKEEARLRAQYRRISKKYNNNYEMLNTDYGKLINIYINKSMKIIEEDTEKHGMLLQQFISLHHRLPRAESLDPNERELYNILIKYRNIKASKDFADIKEYGSINNTEGVIKLEKILKIVKANEIEETELNRFFISQGDKKSSIFLKNIVQKILEYKKLTENEKKKFEKQDKNIKEIIEIYDEIMKNLKSKELDGLLKIKSWIDANKRLPLKTSKNKEEKQIAKEFIYLQKRMKETREEFEYLSSNHKQAIQIYNRILDEYGTKQMEEKTNSFIQIEPKSELEKAILENKKARNNLIQTENFKKMYGNLKTSINKIEINYLEDLDTIFRFKEYIFENNITENNLKKRIKKDRLERLYNEYIKLDKKLKEFNNLSKEEQTNYTDKEINALKKLNKENKEITEKLYSSKVLKTKELLNWEFKYEKSINNEKIDQKKLCEILKIQRHALNIIYKEIVEKYDKLDKEGKKEFKMNRYGFDEIYPNIKKLYKYIKNKEELAETKKYFQSKDLSRILEDPEWMEKRMRITRLENENHELKEELSKKIIETKEKETRGMD